jgi:hypothetical protein
VRSGLSVEPSASKYQAFSMLARKWTLAAKLRPVWQPCVQIGRPAADASEAIRSASVMPPPLDRWRGHRSRSVLSIVAATARGARPL